MDPIIELANQYQLTVIEDNAQCFLGKYKDRLAGTIRHMSMFSFENSKHLSVGEGGMVITHDSLLAEQIRKYAGIGYKNLTADGERIKLNEEVFQNPAYKRHDCIGFNYRMTELCAAVGVAQMEQADEIVKRHQDIANLYAEAIEEYSWLLPQKVPEGYTHTYWSYAIKYAGEKVVGASWQEFYKIYKEMGGDGFYAAWSIPYQEPALSHLKGNCPIAEAIQPKIMQFKANYRVLELAKQKSHALKKTIQYFQK